MSALQSYLDSKLDSIFSGGGRKNIGLLLSKLLSDFFDNVAKTQDVSLLVQSVANMDEAVLNSMDEFSRRKNVEWGVDPTQFLYVAQDYLFRYLVSSTNDSFFSANSLKLDTLKAVIQHFPLRNSKDRFFSAFSMYSSTISKSIADENTHSLLSMPDVLNLSTAEKCYFVASGAQILSDYSDDVLYYANLPPAIRHNPIVMGLNRRNGPITATLHDKHLRHCDVERLNAYTDKPFLMALEALAIDFYANAELNSLANNELSALRRTDAFNHQLDAIVENALSERPMTLLVSEYTKHQVGLIKTCSTFTDLQSLLSEMKLQDPTPDLTSLIDEQIADRAFLLKAVGEQIIDIAQSYPSQHQQSLFHREDLEPEIPPYINDELSELKALLNILDPADLQLKKQFGIVNYVMETMNLSPLHELFVSVITMDEQTLGAAGSTLSKSGELMEKLLGAAPLRCLTSLSTDKRVHDDFVYHICDICSDTSAIEYFHHRHFIEDVLATAYASYQLRKPDQKIADRLLTIAKNRDLDTDYVMGKFSVLFNQDKQIPKTDVESHADLSFLTPKTI